MSHERCACCRQPADLLLHMSVQTLTPAGEAFARDNECGKPLHYLFCAACLKVSSEAGMAAVFQPQPPAKLKH